MEPIKIIECPRDAMQGIQIHPYWKKVAYIQSLLRVIWFDLGVLSRQKRFRKCRIPLLCLGNWICRKQKKLLAIIANTRGAQMASTHAEINT
jgi:hydroxymethylglutaryl-CoA lyase